VQRLVNISSYLLVNSFSFLLQSNTRFFEIFALKLFEFEEAFEDSHLMISCILRLDKSRISTFNLIDCNASDYAFINKKFAQIHEILLRFLKYARRLKNFNNQSILIENITHVVEVIMNLNKHVKKLFFFVIKLKNYLIVLSHS
jgi:hypothetical protein